MEKGIGLAVVLLVLSVVFEFCAAASRIPAAGFMSDMVQRPILYFGEATTSGLEVGEPCSFGWSCESGCCLVERKSGRRRCRRKAAQGERCSVGQIKLDMYTDFCPCIKGNKFCSEDPEPRCLS
ncbi:hypothetical protein JTE90_016872 [Oedothorax gibbosus]|uniref:Uncharacterized protein n=1 Tax=Oedothorax gibbosus TaxID=931172 RepID=A0AAV6W143_9ARAC|nr:hypothetical protein JTE90_016872 [Oedothorax gibbosus]